MTNDQSGCCWMCGAPADSREHIFKARDLKRFFDEDGYAPEALPFHFSVGGHRRIPGPKSDRMKFPSIICRRCNNERTSKFDKAYDELSDWFAARQSDYAINQMDLVDIFGPRYSERVDDLRRFFAKSLGCRIVAAGSTLPSNFPSPLRGSNMGLLQVSVCRAQPFRDIELTTSRSYEPELFERSLAKGDLFAHQSRSHLENTGKSVVTSALWWENVGHFQINYWFNINMNTALGGPLDGLNRIYRIEHCEVGLADMKEMMGAWLGTH